MVPYRVTYWSFLLLGAAITVIVAKSFLALAAAAVGVYVAVRVMGSNA